MSKKNNGQLLTAMFAGAVVGAAVGILYAPQSGKVTRSKIEKGAERATTNLASVTKSLSQNAQQNMEESSDSLGYLIGSAIARTVLTISEISEIIKTKLIELNLETGENSTGNQTINLPENNKVIDV